MCRWVDASASTRPHPLAPTRKGLVYSRSGGKETEQCLGRSREDRLRLCVYVGVGGWTVAEERRSRSKEGPLILLSLRGVSVRSRKGERSKEESPDQRHATSLRLFPFAFGFGLDPSQAGGLGSPIFTVRAPRRPTARLNCHSAPPGPCRGGPLHCGRAGPPVGAGDGRAPGPAGDGARVKIGRNADVA